MYNIAQPMAMANVLHKYRNAHMYMAYLGEQMCLCSVVLRLSPQRLSVADVDEYLILDPTRGGKDPVVQVGNTIRAQLCPTCNA